jgi:UDP-N-acetylmuramoyl-tripeptide--D-alanyl-D-alanine ligase
MALSFALAHKIGLSATTIIAALNTTPQIHHRLEVIKEKNKPIVIDDAYNSNPTGSTHALEVLQLFKEQGYRAIVITPGMVELGDLHETKHFELGVKTAAVADYVLVIMPSRIQSFIDGFNKYASKDQILLTFNTFREAKNWLHINAQTNDVILLENDLPDLYESTINL